jgi:regulator of cell morphogenesis and NO signaling
MKITQELFVEKISESERGSDHEIETMNCDLLAGFIVDTHHQYAINAIPRIHKQIENVINLQPENHSGWSMIRSYFMQLSNELLLHMRKEEMVLFPYIKNLVAAQSEGKSVEPPVFGSAKLPISAMEMEHRTSEILQKKLTDLCGGYVVSGKTDKLVSKLYSELRIFDNDLQRHIHLENNILFPKTIELERSVLG